MVHEFDLMKLIYVDINATEVVSILEVPLLFCMVGFQLGDPWTWFQLEALGCDTL